MQARYECRGTDGARLFQSSELLTTSQVTSLSSLDRAPQYTRVIPKRLIFKQLSREESKGNQAKKEAVAAIQLDNPLIYDQYNLCAIAVDGTLKLLKLPMLHTAHV